MAHSAPQVTVCVIIVLRRLTVKSVIYICCLIHGVVFMFAPCTSMISIIKNTFIVPTDAHYYKIIGMLKQFKEL